MRRLVWQAPLGFMPLTVLTLGLWAGLPPDMASGERPTLMRALGGMAVVAAVYALVLGYAYVLLAQLGFVLGRRCGWIRHAEPASPGG